MKLDQTGPKKAIWCLKVPFFSKLARCQWVNCSMLITEMSHFLKFFSELFL